MITSVALPDPRLLWTRWAVLAVALNAIGFDDVWTVGERGGHLDDGGGNWSHLALVEGGRAVLFGYDHEYSATLGTDPPLDLLDGAPAWLPWDDLVARAENDDLGYVLWYDDGRWSRVGYPDGVEDGLDSTAGPVLDDAATVAELGEFVWEWGEHDVDTPAEHAAVARAAQELVGAAGRRAVDASGLEALLGRLAELVLDASAGMAVAARGGISAGTAPPVIAAGIGAPPRRVRRWSNDGLDRLVWSAMQESAELAGPVPAASPELDALVGWMRGRAPAADGRCSLLFYADHNSLSARDGEHPPAERPTDDRFGSFNEAVDLVDELRRAEAYPDRGRWFFLRVETTATGVTVERCYDSWPSWWPDNDNSGPWRDGLQVEVEKRAPSWRPAWSVLLDPDLAYEQHVG